MKRYISLALAAVVLVVSLAVPSYAAEYDTSSYLNLLDFTTIDPQFLPAGENKEVTVSLPLRGYYYSVDLVLTKYTPSGSYHSFDAYVKRGSELYPLTVTKIADSVYRVYGSFYAVPSDSITLVFNAEANSNIYINNFLVNYFSSTRYDSSLTGELSYIEDNIAKDVSLSKGEGITFLADFPSEGSLNLFPSDWRKFDYIDILLYLDLYSISSISAHLEGQSIPTSVSYIASEGSVANVFFLNLRLDLRNIDRSTNSNVVVNIALDCKSEFFNQVTLTDCVGYVLADVAEPLPYFFNNLFSNLSTWFGNVGTWISNQTTTLTNGLSTWFGNVNTWISNQTTSLINKFNNLEALLNDLFIDEAGWHIGDRLWIFYNSTYEWISSQTTTIKSTISTWGQKIVDALTPDSSDADSVVDKTQQQAQEMDSNNNALQQLERPDFVGGVTSGDISSIVTPGNTVKYTLFLSRIMQAPILSDVIMLSMIFSLAAYVLFGKR